MHIEILVEDASGAKLVEILLPKIFTGLSALPTWKIHPYKGIGTLPKNLTPKSDANKRLLLERLPQLLGGLSKTPGIDAVVVLVDSDRRDCKEFLQELKGLLVACDVDSMTVLFRLAIEEVEAWYFGDLAAIKKAYPSADQKILKDYQQDSVCGTWEMLLRATHLKGKTFKKEDSRWRFPNSGIIKCEWAERIGPWIDTEKNQSPSFQKFRTGLLRLVGN